MPERGQRLVVVLCEHPLLGEGIARFLVLAETGADVVFARAGNTRAAHAALARDPDVVVFECTRCDLDLALLAPRAVVIDVSAAMSTGDTSPRTACMETIVAAARGAQEPTSCDETGAADTAGAADAS